MRPAEGQSPGSSVLRRTPAEALAELGAQVRARNAIQRMELSLGNQIGAVEREMKKYGVAYPADFATAEFRTFERAFRLRRLAIERVVAGLVNQIPVGAWWLDHRGLAAMGLGQILAITGDLGKFSTVAKLWKFMSLHVINGKAARRVKGDASQGYSPFRRTVMHQIGEALLKVSGRGARKRRRRGQPQAEPGPYYQHYVRRKALELTKLPKTEKGRKGHAHRRALRWVEKRILRDLWKAWRRLGGTA